MGSRAYVQQPADPCFKNKDTGKTQGVLSQTTEAVVILPAAFDVNKGEGTSRACVFDSVKVEFVGSRLQRGRSRGPHGYLASGFVVLMMGQDFRNVRDQEDHDLQRCHSAATNLGL